MMNTNYTTEKAMATSFIREHTYDTDLMKLIDYLIKNKTSMTHSDKWSYIYDWMQNYYPEATGSLITGFVYWIDS